MFYFYFFFIPEQILKYFSQLIQESNPDFQISSLFTVLSHIFIGAVTAFISVLIVYFAFRLLRFTWRKIKHTSVGIYLDKELLPILRGIDWWMCLVVCFCSEILIEYWQIFSPMVRSSNLVKEVFNFFVPNGQLDTQMRSFIRMMNYYGVSIIFYFLLPLFLLIGRHIKTGDKYYLKYTFSPGKWKIGLPLLIACWIFMLIVLYIAMGLSPELRSIYPMGGNKAILSNINLFLIYELGALLYLMAFEYYFRGIFFFEFEKKIGSYAILIMVLPYIIHKFGKPSIEIVSAIIAGLALGIMSKWTRTFLYGALLHFLVSFSADIMATLYREGVIIFPFQF